ncbi:MAG: hypothetical protein ABIR24_12135 [Verrucomicrobiota bacterium]
MKQSTIVPVRLTVVAVLHFALVYFLFDWLYGGVPKHFYFRFDFALLKIAISAFCIASLIPVLLRGDWVQRLITVGLVILPIIIFVVALKPVVELFSYAYF